MTTEQNKHSYAAQYGDLTAEERQIEATLALTFEQRTANLITFYRTVDARPSVYAELEERLGLK